MSQFIYETKDYPTIRRNKNEIPGSYASSKNTVCDMSSSELAEIPNDLILNNITQLDLSNNNFEVFPKELLQLNTLEVLLMRCNKLKTLHPNLSQLNLLRELYLDANLLESDAIEASSIHQLPKLTLLHLSKNRITYIPNAICNCANLQSLSLSNNSIKKIPEEFRELKNLKWISLSNNDLESLGEDIPKLVMLKGIAISKNPNLDIDKARDQLRHLSLLCINDMHRRENEFLERKQEYFKIKTQAFLEKRKTRLMEFNPKEILEAVAVVPSEPAIPDLDNIKLSISMDFIDNSAQGVPLAGVEFNNQRSNLSEIKAEKPSSLKEVITKESLVMQELKVVTELRKKSIAIPIASDNSERPGMDDELDGIIDSYYDVGKRRDTAKSKQPERG